MSIILEPLSTPLRGAIRLPGDKSISHRAALLGPLASGPCVARGWLDAQDTRRSLDAVRALGADAVFADGDLRIAPGGFPGARGSQSPAADMPALEIDCGNSGTTARLLIGLLAGREARVRLDGDASLRRRPMGRVLRPLRRLGARTITLKRAGRLPLEIEGRPLRGGSCRLAVPSAQAKSALLLAGLASAEPVLIEGCGSSRDHTERLLRLMGATVESAGDGGGRVALLATGPLRPFDVTVPGDPSSAAFALVAAAMIPGSEVVARGMLLNPTRIGFLRVMERMGADITVAPSGDGWEPVGDVTVRHAPLRGYRIAADEVPGLIDELPILAVLAAAAEGVSVVSGAAELRSKESDRIAAIVSSLRAFGIPAIEAPDGFTITGPVRPGQGRRRLRLATGGDHRIAMALAVAALGAGCETELDDTDCVAVSFPGFFDIWRDLREGNGS